jgi:O-methyltransferase
MTRLLNRITQYAQNDLDYVLSRLASMTDHIMDAEFGDIYARCKRYSQSSKERMYALYKATRYIVASKIPGDFVECGVLKGGSTMMMAYTLLEMQETIRRIYLYDTFEGMPQPSKDDYLLSNKDNRYYAIDEWRKKQKIDHNEWDFSPLSEVKANMLSTGYPKEYVVFVKGKVEDTIPNTIPHNIALLRLDTDWYESTKHELIHLYPLISPNGVLIIDDYGYWVGAKKAVDEYFSNMPILLNRIDNTGRIGIKSACCQTF